MGLLWSSQKRPVSNLPSSSARVNKMMDRLDQGKMKKYDDNIIKLQQDGEVEDSPSDQDDRSVFFLPHRGPYRNDKLRIVFDGSAKDGNGVSLNDYLEPGENSSVDWSRCFSTSARIQSHVKPMCKPPSIKSQ